jgi:hypothetical protein
MQHIWRTAMATLLLALALGVQAGEPSASWTGLTGLYAQPTAESLPAQHFALTFSEIRFVQTSTDDQRLKNRVISGIVSYGFTDRLEACVRLSHDVIDYGLRNSDEVLFSADGNVFTGDVKYVLTPPTDGRIGLAVGVNDILDRTDRINGTHTDRGIRLFAVGTYRWFTLGATANKHAVGGYSGARVALTERIDLVVEYSVPPVFAQTTPKPDYNVNFNLGIRMYPIQVPGLRADIAAVGDGDFDFGFSFSYRRPL